MRMLLGVDGGGTTTRATLATFSGDEFKVVAQGRSESSNVVTDGIDIATVHIQESIRLAFAQLDLRSAPVESACFAIAGSERASVREPLNRWIEKANIATRHTLVNDAEPILFTLSSSGHGVAVICGTGSLAYGRDSTGKTARAGGWGPLMSDEGSGYWIAIEGLKAVMRAFDGRVPKTVLTNLIQTELDLRSVAEIPHVVGQMDRSQIASLAGCVSDAAGNFDLAALKILKVAGTELAALASRVIEQLAFLEERTIGVSGSVLLNSPIVSDRFEAILNSSGLPTQISPVPNCATGLLTIALRDAR